MEQRLSNVFDAVERYDVARREFLKIYWFGGNKADLDKASIESCGRHCDLLNAINRLDTSHAVEFGKLHNFKERK
jgi:hypothetical protein